MEEGAAAYKITIKQEDAQPFPPESGKEGAKVNE